MTEFALWCTVQTVAGTDSNIQTASRAGQVRARIWWTAGTVLAAAALMFCYLRIAGTTRVNSDGAANALQGWAMLHGNVLLHGWLVTDVSFWTTELPQYALVSAVAGLRPEVVHICAAVTYTLLVLLTALAARGRATGAEAVGRALLAAVILLAPEPGAGAYLVLLDPDHVGTGVPVLAVLLLLDLAPRRWWVPVLTAVLLTWGLLSDPLFLIVAVGPLAALLITRIVLALRRHGSTVGDLWFEFSLTAATALAMIAARAATAVVTARGGFNVHPLLTEPKSGLLAGLAYDVRGVLALFGADPGNSPHAWGPDPGGAPSHLQSGPEVAFALIHLLGVAVVIAAVAVAARRLLRTLGSPAIAREDLVSGLMVVMIVVNLAAFFALYRPRDVLIGREAAPVLVLAAALAGRQFGAPLARAVLGAAGRARTRLRVSLAAVVACCCVMLGYAAAQPQVPPASASLAGWLADHDLREGLAEYWDANSLTLDSGGALTVAAVSSIPGSARLSPLGWEEDMRLFDPATHRANFLVLAHYPDVTLQRAVKTFGRPAKTYHYEEYTILVWQENLLRYLGAPVT
jgi:hypothetical protein